MWNSAPILRDVCDNNNGASKDTDRWKFQINESIITAVPLGTGDKIRGMRANIIIADEFSSINPTIYEAVVQGFASVEADPIEKMKNASRRRKLVENNKWTEEQQHEYLAGKGNQVNYRGNCRI